MEEVFGFNIRPINHAPINNFFSSEFAIPGGNNTKIYRMDSSTLICGMITNYKFDSKSKFIIRIFWGLWREEKKALIKSELWDIEFYGMKY